MNLKGLKKYFRDRRQDMELNLHIPACQGITEFGHTIGYSTGFSIDAGYNMDRFDHGLILLPLYLD
jgi:hypothetical protein